MARQRRLPAVLMIVAAVALVSAVAMANQVPVVRLSAYRAEATSVYAVLYDASGSSDSDGQVVKHQWVFGDGKTGSGSIVTHTYDQAGPFTVTLLVWDDGGASASLTRTIDVATLPSQSDVAASGNSGTTSTSSAEQVPIGVDVGLRAPEIALPGLTGGTVYLSSYLGRPVLVEFWLSTCPGCVASTPQLELYRTTYAAQGLVVMLVVLDRNPSAALTFLYRQYNYTNFVLAWESDARKPTVAAYAIPGTPYTFLIDETGIIRYAGRPDGLTDEVFASQI
jgi:thiol-disulfide isomerase/thioredoxin